VRLGKRALVNQGRYGAARPRKRARRETRNLRTYLGRVLRNVERERPKLSTKQEQIVSIARRIFWQQRTDHGKVYSVHAPEVECIAKGKVHQHSEFGCQVPIVTTSRQSWIVGIEAKHDTPYDGVTLKPALAQVQRVTGVRPEEAFVDQGFRGQRYHPRAVAVYISGRRNLTPQLRKLLQRRSAIEPVIGHTKHDHGMNRNYLLGKVGEIVSTPYSVAVPGTSRNCGAILSHIHSQCPLPDFFRDDYLFPFSVYSGNASVRQSLRPSQHHQIVPIIFSTTSRSFLVSPYPLHVPSINNKL
jgi:transposase, IS5 family